MLRSVLKGEVVVKRGLLQSSGVEALVRGMLGFPIETLPALHTLYPYEEIVRMNIYANRRVDQYLYDIVIPLIKDGLGYDAPVYLNNKAVVRFFAPFDFLNEHEQTADHKAKKCCQGAGSGMVRYHGPHRDSWYDTSENSINIWLALTDVKRGNSMVIYPDVYHEDIKHDGVKVKNSQVFGQPHTFEIDYGDAIIFNSHHLHSTELNTTNDTRGVITFRFSLDKPRFSAGALIGKRPRYYRSDHIGTPLEKLTMRPNLVWQIWQKYRYGL